MEPGTVVAFVVSALLVVLYKWLRRRSISNIRGPPSPSWLFGHQLMQSRSLECAEDDFEWAKEYGTAYRLKACLGEDHLVISDPKALQHIFHKSGYNYAKPNIVRQISRQISGDGIISSDGHDHMRQRRVMSPAFSVLQLRGFLPLFNRTGLKLVELWKSQLAATESQTKDVINVHNGLTRTTLDIVGEAAYDFQCGALDDHENEVMKSYKNMFADSLLWPSKVTLVFRSLWKYIPLSILRYVEYLPYREYRRFRQTLVLINDLSRKLIREKTQAIAEGKAELKKDIMSIIIKANASENPATRMTDKEMVAQMANFLLAGHDTTSLTLSWLLWELAKIPEYQSKMREEIKAMRARVVQRGDTEFSILDFDSMTFTTAAMKEALRIHPIVYTNLREALIDDILPLSIPITSKSGEVITEIPIRKGQNIVISIAAYNRLPEVWGEDAHVFNPERFLVERKEQQVTLGNYANLMTFSGGVRGCIGWRFSVLETQSILANLIENFEFSLPEDHPEIQRLPAGLMVPMVRGKMHLGTQMPLRVSLVEESH